MEGKGREGKGREGNGREGKGKEGERKGVVGKGREEKGRSHMSSWMRWGLVWVGLDCGDGSSLEQGTGNCPPPLPASPFCGPSRPVIMCQTFRKHDGTLQHPFKGQWGARSTCLSVLVPVGPLAA